MNKHQSSSCDADYFDAAYNSYRYPYYYEDDYRRYTCDEGISTSEYPNPYESNDNESESHSDSDCDSKEEYRLSELLPVPSDWYKNTKNIEEVLNPNDPEYKKVKAMLKGIPLKNLTKISRIQNSYLYQRFMIRKLEYEALGTSFFERYLFHATGESNIPSILENNLNWRLVKRAKFGRGVSFSPYCKYANAYCNQAIGNNRAMIIAKVLIGKMCSGDRSVKIPPRGFDTSVRLNGEVIVKYYDDEFYPQYVVYYSNTTK